MKDADMIFGWVEDGEAKVLDLYTTGSTGLHRPDTEIGGERALADDNESTTKHNIAKGSDKLKLD